MEKLRFRTELLLYESVKLSAVSISALFYDVNTSFYDSYKFIHICLLKRPFDKKKKGMYLQQSFQLTNQLK